MQISHRHCGNQCRRSFDKLARQNSSTRSQKCCTCRVIRNLAIQQPLFGETTDDNNDRDPDGDDIPNCKEVEEATLSFQAKYLCLLHSYLVCNLVQAHLATKKPDAISPPHSPQSDIALVKPETQGHMMPSLQTKACTWFTVRMQLQ